uniref:Uncharacterized protein n=1 Tax=Arundo donax TaxID=35708 RepID=A0A0A9FIN6_ARUDO
MIHLCLKGRLFLLILDICPFSSSFVLVADG